MRLTAIDDLTVPTHRSRRIVATQSRAHRQQCLPIYKPHEGTQADVLKLCMNCVLSTLVEVLQFEHLQSTPVLLSSPHITGDSTSRLRPVYA